MNVMINVNAVGPSNFHLLMFCVKFLFTFAIQLMCVKGTSVQ